MNTAGVVPHPGQRLLMERDDFDMRGWQATMRGKANLAKSLSYNEGFQDGGGAITDVNAAEKSRAAWADVMAHIATLPSVAA